MHSHQRKHDDDDDYSCPPQEGQSYYVDGVVVLQTGVRVAPLAAAAFAGVVSFAAAFAGVAFAAAVAVAPAESSRSQVHPTSQSSRHPRPLDSSCRCSGSDQSLEHNQEEHQSLEEEAAAAAAVGKTGCDHLQLVLREAVRQVGHTSSARFASKEWEIKSE